MSQTLRPSNMGGPSSTIHPLRTSPFNNNYMVMPQGGQQSRRDHALEARYGSGSGQRAVRGRATTANQNQFGYGIGLMNSNSVGRI